MENVQVNSIKMTTVGLTLEHREIIMLVAVILVATVLGLIGCANAMVFGLPEWLE